MQRFQTIVVAAALDDRDAALLSHAARFARAAQARAVYLAHVAPSFDLPEGAGEELRGLAVPVDEDIEQRLQGMVAAHTGLFPAATSVHCVVRQGPLVPELVRLLAQKSADLFCLGRRPPEDHDALSDSALRLLRKAPCSVLVAPAGAATQYDRILVPVDFSEHSREALEVACALGASIPDATVTVQHVYGVPLGWHKSGHSYEEFSALMKGHAERRWGEFVAAVDTRGVPLQVRFDPGEKVPKTILACADAVDAGLIVLGSHGRTRPAAVLLGHVADTVCSRTSRPTLCVKRKGEVVNFLHALLQSLDLESE